MDKEEKEWQKNLYEMQLVFHHPILQAIRVDSEDGLDANFLGNVHSK